MNNRCLVCGSAAARKVQEEGEEFYYVFVDLSKAYDRVCAVCGRELE